MPLVPYSDTSSSSSSSSSSSDEDRKDRLSLTRKRKKKQKGQQKKQARTPPVEPLFQIEPRTHRKSRKFKTQSQVYDVTFKKYSRPFETTRILFHQLVESLKEQCHVQSRDQVRVSIQHPGLDFGIHIPFDLAVNITGDQLLDECERVVQSNQNFKIHDGEMTAEITHISMPEGAGKARRSMHHGSHVRIENMTLLKRSVVTIENTDDSMCLARAIVVGMCHANKEDTEEWRKRWHLMRQSERPLQTREAQALLDRVGIGYDQACGVKEYKTIQESVYPAYVIKVHPQHAKDQLLFKPPSMTRNSQVIHVYHHDRHFDCIVSIKGFLGKSYYCEYCDIGYYHKEQHWCQNMCVCYASEICDQVGGGIKCQTCLRWFRSPACYQNHVVPQGKTKKSICQAVHRCPSCSQIIVWTKKNHLCAGTKKCKYCKKTVGPDHDCYIPIYQSNEMEEPPMVPFIFYDFECRFDTGEHIPNFCVAQRACGECIRKPVTKPCLWCDQVPGRREVVFRGDQTLTEFCTWLFDPVHCGATVIAHNAQGYDAQFILRHVVTHGTNKPEVIMNGGKILMMKTGGVRFIDSLSYLSMPLSAFPKTFGLTEMAKGFFPFWANTEEFQNYVGPILPLEYYKPGRMKPEQRKAFLTWYHDHSQDVFDFQKEMETYCRSDVDILRRGCGEFRQQLLDSDEIDPFIEATTLAQACNKAWRKNSMPAQSLGIIPDGGYPAKVRYSMKAIRWIQLSAMVRNRSICHALNRGEVRLGPYYVDGFDPKDDTVYEFFGCLFHGCPRCFHDRQKKNPFTLETMEALYQKTNDRILNLSTQGYKVKYVWECDYDRFYSQCPEYRQVLDQLYPHMDEIQPREALFGGRTNAVRLYYDVTGNQEIKYADICSLYPYVNKYKEYPIGHPRLITQESISMEAIRDYRGLIKCQVLPPQDLWMPVLPVHCHHKMVFTLCRTCAEEECSVCTHTEADRALVGTWTSVELHKALDKGYQILAVYHVWHWDQWSCNVYRQYIDKYLKMKQESSGYPPWVQTPDDEQKFKQDYFEAEGIQLDQVQKNPGKRAFAKTMLNCLWGKNAQNNVLPKTEYVGTQERYQELLSDPQVKIHHVELFDHDQFILVNFTDQSDKFEPHNSSNVVVASFVTAYARLELYSVLEPLGERVLYFDTDSCMYIYEPGQYNIPIVDSRLGQWTDEVPNGKIVKFVGLGPKNYGYEYIENGETRTQCKVKGITLDYDTTQKVNFKTMLECVRDRTHYSLVVEYPSRIKRHRDRKVTSEPHTKTFRSVYTKRVVTEDYKTVPYGYRPHLA